MIPLCIFTDVIKYILNDIQSLEKFESSQKGEFSLSDLRTLRAPTHQQEFYQRISEKPEVQPYREDENEASTHILLQRS